jgi:hypothetical protein
MEVEKGKARANILLAPGASPLKGIKHVKRTSLLLGLSSAVEIRSK